MAAPTRTPRLSWIEGTRLTPADDAARTRKCSRSHSSTCSPSEASRSRRVSGQPRERSRDLRQEVAVGLLDDTVLELADAIDLHAHDVAHLQQPLGKGLARRAHAGGRARGDHVARLE